MAKNEHDTQHRSIKWQKNEHDTEVIRSNDDYEVIRITDLIVHVHNRHNMAIYKCFKPLDHWEAVAAINSNGHETVGFDIINRPKHKTIGGLARKLVNNNW